MLDFRDLSPQQQQEILGSLSCFLDERIDEEAKDRECDRRKTRSYEAANHLRVIAWDLRVGGYTP